MPICSFEATSESPAETRRYGRVLGRNARPGDVYLLVGELGAGKTCLTQGVLWGLGGHEFARSATFVLASQYPARLTLYHIDLFRLDDPAEAMDLGLEEYLYGNGVCVVEWADKAMDVFPKTHLKVEMEVLGARTRRLRFSADACGYADLLEALMSKAAGG